MVMQAAVRALWRAFFPAVGTDEDEETPPNDWDASSGSQREQPVPSPSRQADSGLLGNEAASPDSDPTRDQVLLRNEAASPDSNPAGDQVPSPSQQADSEPPASNVPKPNSEPRPSNVPREIVVAKNLPTSYYTKSFALQDEMDETKTACPQKYPWERNKPPQTLALNLSPNAHSTPLYHKHSSRRFSLKYDDTWDLWLDCMKFHRRVLHKLEFEDDKKDPPRNLVDLWERRLKKLLSDDNAVDNLRLEKQAGEHLVDQVVFHALRLAKTPPTIFGPGCFRMSAFIHRQAFFEFKAYSDDDTKNFCTEMQALLKERHDIVQWMAVLGVFGKNFELTGWAPTPPSSARASPPPSVRASASPDSNGKPTKTAVPKPKPIFEGDLAMFPQSSGPDLSAIYAHVKQRNSVQGDDDSQATVGEITEAAHGAMTLSIDHTTCAPTPYHRLLYVATAVAFICGETIEEHFMKQDQSVVEQFSWASYHPDYKSTHPQVLEPPQDEFDKVGLVHKQVKDEKEKLAIALRVPFASVYTFKRYKELWKLFREVITAYRFMFPQETKSAVLSMAERRLGKCTTEKKLKERLSLDISIVQRQVEEGVTVSLAEPEAPPTKKQKRNNTTLLNLGTTPRQRATSLGPAWEPPKRNKEKKKRLEYEAPGDLWKEDAHNKVVLLERLRNLLVAAEVIQSPMTFASVVDAIDKGRRKKSSRKLQTENDRFLFLLSLIVRHSTQW